MLQHPIGCLAPFCGLSWHAGLHVACDEMFVAFFRSSKPNSRFHCRIHFLGAASAPQPSVLWSRFQKQNRLTPGYNVLLVPRLVQFLKARSAIGLNVESIMEPRGMAHDPRPTWMARVQLTLEPKFSMHLHRVCQPSHSVDCTLGTSIACWTVERRFFDQSGALLAPPVLIFWTKLLMVGSPSLRSFTFSCRIKPRNFSAMSTRWGWLSAPLDLAGMAAT